jgi:hypothetical protein
MSEDRVDFIECTSLNLSYDVMGRVTVNYTVVHNYFEFVVYTSVSAGGQTFTGYIMNASVNAIPHTEGWYETHATLIATTD